MICFNWALSHFSRLLFSYQVKCYIEAPFFIFSVQSNILYTFIISIHLHLLFKLSSTVLLTLSPLSYRTCLTFRLSHSPLRSHSVSAILERVPSKCLFFLLDSHPFLAKDFYGFLPHIYNTYIYVLFSNTRKKTMFLSLNGDLNLYHREK